MLPLFHINSPIISPCLLSLPSQHVSFFLQPLPCCSLFIFLSYFSFLPFPSHSYRFPSLPHSSPTHWTSFSFPITPPPPKPLTYLHLSPWSFHFHLPHTRSTPKPLSWSLYSTAPIPALTFTHLPQLSLLSVFPHSPLIPRPSFPQHLLLPCSPLITTQRRITSQESGSPAPLCLSSPSSLSFSALLYL